MKALVSLRDKWTDCALRLYARHGKALQAAHDADLSFVNDQVGLLLAALRVRLGDETPKILPLLQSLSSAVEDVVLVRSSCAPTDSNSVADVAARVASW